MVGSRNLLFYGSVTRVECRVQDYDDNDHENHDHDTCSLFFNLYLQPPWFEGMERNFFFPESITGYLLLTLSSVPLALSKIHRVSPSSLKKDLGISASDTRET